MVACHGGKGTGTQYTYAELEGLWINAGGPKSLAPTMAAIAEAESGGCSTAYNSSGATGLWQILGAVYPKDQASLTDPATNAREAVAKYKTQGLGAWVTYTTGAYKAYLNGSTTPNTNVPGSGSSGATSATLTATQSAECLFAMPSVDLGITSVGGGCLLAKTNARAILGGLILTGGIIVGGVGVVLLAAFGFGKSSAGQKAIAAAQLVPGVGPAAKAAGAAVSSSGGSRARRAPPARESSSAAPPA